VNKMKSWTSIGHPQCVSPEASYPPNNREKRPLLASNCQQALRGALKARWEKEGELATTSLEFEFHLQFPCGSLSTELSDFSANRREAETSANANKI